MMYYSVGFLMFLLSTVVTAQFQMSGKPQRICNRHEFREAIVTTCTNSAKRSAEYKRNPFIFSNSYENRNGNPIFTKINQPIRPARPVIPLEPIRPGRWLSEFQIKKYDKYASPFLGREDRISMRPSSQGDWDSNERRKRQDIEDELKERCCTAGCTYNDFVPYCPN